MHATLLGALVWLLQPSSAHGAFGTMRPAECGLAEGSRAANAWERAKEPNLRRYCNLLASAAAKLVGAGGLVKEVPRIADDADRLLPGRAAPSVLKGRALLRLGKADEALAALLEAKQRDARALDDPVALLAWARANARTGHLAEAADAYRAALPRTSALTPQERGAASFEAGLTVMAEGPASVDAAVAMFRQARRDAQDALHVASVVALALALDRAGQREEASAVLANRALSGVEAMLAEPSVTEALANAGVAHEGAALAALAREGAGGGRDGWRAYLDGAGGKGTWAAHARARAGAAKAPAAKAPAAKAPAEKAPAVKAPAVKAPVVKAPAAKAPGGVK